MSEITWPNSQLLDLCSDDGSELLANLSPAELNRLSEIIDSLAQVFADTSEMQVLSWDAENVLLILPSTTLNFQVSFIGLDFFLDLMTTPPKKKSKT